MRRRDFIGLIGGTVALPFAAQAQRAQTIDEALREAVERKEIPGVVAMAADRNGVVYQGAFGMADIAEARPVKLDALFRLASMTKPVTAVAAMQLVEQRRIGLGRSRGEVFPGVRQAVRLGVVRCGHRRLQAASGHQACHRAPPLHATPPASATASRARRCAITSRAPATPPVR